MLNLFLWEYAHVFQSFMILLISFINLFDLNIDLMHPFFNWVFSFCDILSQQFKAWFFNFDANCLNFFWYVRFRFHWTKILFVGQKIILMSFFKSIECPYQLVRQKRRVIFLDQSWNRSLGLERILRHKRRWNSERIKRRVENLWFFFAKWWVLMIWREFKFNHLLVLVFVRDGFLAHLIFIKGGSASYLLFYDSV